MFEAPTSDTVPETSDQLLSQSDGASNESSMAVLVSPFLSKPVTIYDPSTKPIDVHILQKIFQAFTDPSCLVLVGKLIPKFTLVYGNSLSHPSLRHAVILYSRTYFPEFSELSEIEDQRRRARSALSRRLKQFDVLDEGDLLAAFFIFFHFALSNDHEITKHAKGTLALAKYMFNASLSSVTRSTFSSFWRMLIRELSTRVEVDESVLHSFQLFILAPTDFENWCSDLDIPWNGKAAPFELSLSYLRRLKFVYMKARRRRDEQVGADDCTISTWIMHAEANLKNADEQYMYFCFNYYLAEGWRSKQVPNPPRTIFLYILHFIFCRFLICVLSPSQGDLSTVLVAATRVFTFFNSIEYSVERLETTLINELELLSLPGSDVREIDDPLLNEGNLIFGSSMLTRFASACTTRLCTTV